VEVTRKDDLGPTLGLLAASAVFGHLRQQISQVVHLSAPRTGAG
jgi:hypothetical protein